MDGRVGRVRHVTMNPVNTILVEPSPEPASDGLIVGEIFPGPRIDPSYRYIVHRSLTSGTYFLWNYACDGLEGHVNDPRGCLHVSTGHRCRWLCVNNRPSGSFNLNRFEAAGVCWNRRVRHTSYHVIDG